MIRQEFFLFFHFDQDGDGLIKKITGYHQFHGVREAVRVTLIASATEDFSKVKEDRATYGKEVVPGSKKAGVFWHTQGSGKSISIVLRREAAATAGDEQPDAGGGDGSQ